MNNIHKHRSAENGTPINKSKGRRTALLLAAVILAASFPMVLMTSEYGYSSGAEETFEKDGLKYKVLSGDATVEVTGFVDGTTPIDITIPETVTDSSNIYTVTNIGDDAFKDCKSLESVTILDSVTSIGSSAFRKCINLESIDLGSVTTIKGWAFEGCTSLESIDLSSVISIYHSVFRGCTKFVSVTIPESVTGMGNEAFRGCTELTDVKFESNTAIGDGAFYGCTKLKNIDLGPVKRINSNAFENCTSLTSITIPSSVTTIGKNVFEGCTELKVAVLPSSLIFEDNVFPTETILLMNDNDDVIVYASMNGENIEMIIDLGEKKIDSVTVTDMDDTAVSVTPSEDIWVFKPEGVKEFKLNIVVVPDGANFKDGGLWYKINEENASEVLVLCAVDANSSSINIPSTVANDGNTYAVTHIGRDAFKNCTSLVSVTIPESVTYIDHSAFYGCSNLGSITIPSSVTYINHSAFRNCSNLGSITIPESVTYIGQNAFRDCRELTDVKFESSTIIDGWAFDNCTKLTNIDLGSVTNIGGNAFRDCKSLVSVTIPESVTYIGNNAFENCTSLKSITIPLTVTSIRENAFNGCTDIIVIVPTSFPSGNWMSSVAFLLKTDSTIISAFLNNERKIEMIIDPGNGKVVDTVTVTDGNDDITVTISGDKWIFDPASGTEFILDIVTSDVPEESGESSDGDNGDDGFWTTTNIVIVGAVAAAAILGLLYVFVIRKP